MMRAVLFLGSLLMMATLVFNRVQLMGVQARIASMDRAALQGAVQTAAENISTQASNAIIAGADPANPLPNPAGIGTIALCPGTTGTSAGSLCGDSVAVTVSFGGSQVSSVGGSSETIVNNNTVLTPSGQAVQGDQTYTIAATLVNEKGTAIDTDTATLHVTTVPLDLVQGASNGPYASITGLSDRFGAIIGGIAEANMTGQCDPTNAANPCAHGGGIDSAAPYHGGGSGADDLRVHAIAQCQSLSTGAGNTCTPTGIPTPPPTTDISNFNNTSMNTTTASGAWKP